MIPRFDRVTISSVCLGMIFFRRPVSTFRDHARGGPTRAASDDRRPLVQEWRFLLPFRRDLYGRQRRRSRRFQGAVTPARLFARAWHHDDLADAVPAVTRQGRWLRHLGLLRRRSTIRHARRLRRVHPWLQATRHPRHYRSRRQPHLRYASLVSPGTKLQGLAISRLVCLGRQEASQRRQGHGLSRRAEIDLDAR